MRYESIQYFVARLFYAQKNKIMKNCIRRKMENQTARVPGNGRFIFLQFAKNETTIAAKICSLLKSVQKLMTLLLMDRRFSLGRRVCMMIQIYNSI